MVQLSFPLTFYDYDGFSGITCPQTISDLAALLLEVERVARCTLEVAEALASRLLMGKPVMLPQGTRTLCAARVTWLD